MRSSGLLTLAVVSLCGCLVGVGCHKVGSTGSDSAAGGEKYLLTAEPADAESITACRAVLEGKQDRQELVICGRIDGLSQPTWDPERAAFMLADLSLKEAKPAEDAATHDKTPKHDAENCPFCKAKTKKELAGLAMVEVVDEQGATPRVDARELLGLKDGQVVVVRGRGQIDALGNLVVQADGIFVRP